MKKFVMLFSSILSFAGLAKADQILKHNFGGSHVQEVDPEEMARSIQF